MKTTRRSLGLLGPLLASGAGQAQDALPSRIFQFSELAVRTNGKNRSRAVLNGKTRNGYGIEMHHTEIAPGLAPHPPHQHAHEEVVVLREGVLDVTIEGKTTRVNAGAVVYVASNQHHGWVNAGETQAHYLVITLGR